MALDSQAQLAFTGNSGTSQLDGFGVDDPYEVVVVVFVSKVVAMSEVVATVVVTVVVVVDVDVLVVVSGPPHSTGPVK